METILYFAAGMVVGALFGAVAMEAFVSLLHGFFPDDVCSKADAWFFSAIFCAIFAFAAICPDAIGLDVFMRDQLGRQWKTVLYGTMLALSLVTLLFMHRRLGRNAIT